MRSIEVVWVCAVVVLAAIGMLIKVSVWNKAVQIDVRSAETALQQSLAIADFSVDPPRRANDWRRSAHRDRCSLLAGAIVDLNRDMVHWERAGTEGRLRYHYRGRVLSDFPRVQMLAEEHMQLLLSRMGLAHSRPAVIATVEKGTCDELPDLSTIKLSAH